MDVMNPVSQVDTTQTEEPQSPEVAEAANDYEPAYEEYVAWVESELRTARTKLAHYKSHNKEREHIINRMQRELSTVNRRLHGRREWIRHLEGSLLVNNQENMLVYYQLSYAEYQRSKRREARKRYNKNMVEGAITRAETSREDVLIYRQMRKKSTARLKETAVKKKEFRRELLAEAARVEDELTFMPMMM